MTSWTAKNHLASAHYCLGYQSSFTYPQAFSLVLCVMRPLKEFIGAFLFKDLLINFES